MNRNPDFVFVPRKSRLAILAHGRYWHRRPEIVQQEIEDYESKGWRTLIIWGTRTGSIWKMVARIQAFIGQS